jgi:hypothetical protein
VKESEGVLFIQLVANFSKVGIVCLREQ